MLIKQEGYFKELGFGNVANLGGDREDSAKVILALDTVLVRAIRLHAANPKIKMNFYLNMILGLWIPRGKYVRHAINGRVNLMLLGKLHIHSFA